MEDIISQIMDEKLDCVLVDYKLSSKRNVSYNGVELASQILEALYDFPIFILTSYEDELFNQEIFDAYQIFDIERYLNDKDETQELNYKIVEQILKHRKQIEIWEKRLKELLPKAGESEKIDSEIIELDSKIEKTIDGKSSLSRKKKEELTSKKIIELLEKINELIGE